MTYHNPSVQSTTGSQAHATSAWHQGTPYVEYPSTPHVAPSSASAVLLEWHECRDPRSTPTHAHFIFSCPAQILPEKRALALLTYTDFIFSYPDRVSLAWSALGPKANEATGPVIQPKWSGTYTYTGEDHTHKHSLQFKRSNFSV